MMQLVASRSFWRMSKKTWIGGEFDDRATSPSLRPDSAARSGWDVEPIYRRRISTTMAREGVRVWVVRKAFALFEIGQREICAGSAPRLTWISSQFVGIPCPPSHPVTSIAILIFSLAASSSILRRVSAGPPADAQLGNNDASVVHPGK
jgi:hypothetical protein